MRDPDAALAGWASRAPSWPRTLSLRRDLALPLVLLAVQLTGAAVADGTCHLFSPPRPLGAVDWVLLVVGPVALVARRRHPVPVLWVSLRRDARAVGLRLDSCELHCRVLRGGHRREALLGLAGAGTRLRLGDLARPARLRVRGPAGKRRAAARGVAAGGGDRGRGDPDPGRAGGRDQSQPSARSAPPAERGAAADRQGPARRDRPQHLADQRPGQHGA